MSDNGFSISPCRFLSSEKTIEVGPYTFVRFPDSIRVIDRSEDDMPAMELETRRAEQIAEGLESVLEE